MNVIRKLFGIVLLMPISWLVWFSYQPHTVHHISFWIVLAAAIAAAGGVQLLAETEAEAEERER